MLGPIQHAAIMNDPADEWNGLRVPRPQKPLPLPSPASLPGAPARHLVPATPPREAALIKSLHPCEIVFLGGCLPCRQGSLSLPCPDNESRAPAGSLEKTKGGIAGVAPGHRRPCRRNPPAPSIHL